MDPIDPILPPDVSIPPVTRPATSDRVQRREHPPDDERRRRHREGAEDEEPPADDDTGEDGPHVDISA